MMDEQFTLDQTFASKVELKVDAPTIVWRWPLTTPKACQANVSVLCPTVRHRGELPGWTIGSTRSWAMCKPLTRNASDPPANSGSSAKYFIFLPEYNMN